MAQNTSSKDLVVARPRVSQRTLPQRADAKVANRATARMARRQCLLSMVGIIVCVFSLVCFLAEGVYGRVSHVFGLEAERQGVYAIASAAEGGASIPLVR